MDKAMRQKLIVVLCAIRLLMLFASLVIVTGCESPDEMEMEILELKIKIAEEFATTRYMGRAGPEILLYSVEEINVLEDGSFEVFMKYFDIYEFETDEMNSDEIERLLVYIDDYGKVVKYEHNGIVWLITDKDRAENYALRHFRGTTFSYHYFEETYAREDGSYEVFLRNVYTDEEVSMRVYMEDGRVAGYECEFCLNSPAFHTHTAETTP